MCNASLSVSSQKNESAAQENLRQQCRDSQREITGGCEGSQSCWLLAAYRPCNMPANLRDGRNQTIVPAATLRTKLQFKLAISPSQYSLTQGRPVPTLTVQR